MKKRLISLLMTLALCLSLAPFAAVPAGAAWSGDGDGSKDDPYQIQSADQLEQFRDIVNGDNGEDQNTAACAVLTADIDLDDTDWTPIGKDINITYTGVFDGQGHSITGLNVNVNVNDPTAVAGLFGNVGGNGVVENLSVSGSVSGTVSAESVFIVAGGITGANSGTVQNCCNTCTVTGTADRLIAQVGGIVGSNSGTVQNCYNTGAIKATDSVVYAGGVVGYISSDGTVLNCYNVGAVTATSTTDPGNPNAGGIVGSNSGTVENCYNVGTAAAMMLDGSARHGGIAGISLFGTVTNCYYNSDTSGIRGGLTDDAFRQRDNFAGFEFGEGKAWTYLDGCYPRLSAFPICTVTYDGNGAASGVPKGNAYQPGDIAVIPGAGEMTNGSKVMRFWNTEAGGTGKNYLPGKTVEFKENTVLYAQWGEPMEISSFADLMTFAEKVNGGETELCAALTADIEAEGDAWLAIGSKDDPYTGVFDGGGHVIRGLDNSAFVDLDAETLQAEYSLSAPPQYVGLFAKIGETGTVRDLGIEDGSLTVKFNASMGHAGSVAGSNLGTIENCWSSCAIVGDNFLSYVGGISGMNYGRILCCRNFGGVTVRAESCAAAGITGVNYGVVQSCYNTGDITAAGDGSGAGGIVEYNSTSGRTLLLLDCYNTGTVTAAGENVAAAGIVSSADGTVERCWNSGKVSAAGEAASCGGIARATISARSVVKDCYNNKDASGVEALGSSAHGTVDNVRDLTDAQFRKKASFTGFDGTVWTFKDGCYPRLSAFPVYTLTYDGNGADSGTVPAGNSWQRGDPAAADPGKLRKTHNTFNGWNTAKDGSGTPYRAGDFLTLTADTTLYAQWRSNSSDHSGGGGAAPAESANPVTVPTAAASTASHGTVRSSAANARAGDKVVLTPEPEEGYETVSVTVTDAKGNEVPVTKNADGTYSFTMPDTAVTITPEFEEIQEPDSSGSDVSDRFRDVKRDAWYHDAVQWAVDQGLMNGVSDTLFAPNDTATRAMVVTMVWRLAGQPAVNDAIPYTDVPQDAWYAEAVRWAASAGTVNGTSETTFSPGAPVTREQLAAILYRYAQAQGKGFEGLWSFQLDYSDADQVSEYAYEPLCWMTMHGVITGMGDGTLAPKANAARAQIAAMFMRFAGEMER